MHLHKVEWGSMSSNTIISSGVDGFWKPITRAPEDKHMKQGIDFSCRPGKNKGVAKL